MSLFVCACLVSSFAVSYVATAVMRRLAPQWGLIDEPAHRKVHVAPIPLGGGIALWLGVVAPLAGGMLLAGLATRSDSLRAWIPAEVAPHVEGVLARSAPLLAILCGATLLAVMGLIDDLKNLPWPPRLLGQLFVAIGLTFAGIEATVFVDVAWVGPVLTVVWILVLVNAFNFLDNMDGLSSGMALIASLLFAVIMLTLPAVEPRWLVGGALLVLAGALGGFLVHNWPPARIFMGDSGSYFVGLLLACLTIRGTFYSPEMNVGRQVMLAPLCILAVPLYDFCSVMVIRLSQGRSPFHADKSHFSHRLVELGLKPRDAVLTIHLATLTTGLGALLLYRFDRDDWSGALLVVALITCVLAIIAILETVGRNNTG